MSGSYLRLHSVAERARSWEPFVPPSGFGSSAWFGDFPAMALRMRKASCSGFGMRPVFLSGTSDFVMSQLPFDC